MSYTILLLFNITLEQVDEQQNNAVS